MTALSELDNQISISAKDTEQVVLACRVEQARQQLLLLLLENQQVAGLIAKQLLKDLKKGTDFSEIILIKNNEEYKHALQLFMTAYSSPAISEKLFMVDNLPLKNSVVQKTGFVQLDDFSSLGIEGFVDPASELMYGLHFLPVYLLEISDFIDKQFAKSTDIDASYTTKLRSYRAELKHLRQEMIASNTGLVAFVAHKYKANTLSFDDLMQEGLVGLIKAVDRFDPQRGNCFSTYAIYWIRQAISRLIVKQDKVVPLPVALAEKSSGIFEAMRKSFLHNERWPTLLELKACCELSEQEIKTISGYYQSTYVTDTGSDEENDEMSIMEKMQQQQFSQPLDDLIGSDLATYMDRAVATLPEKQAIILSMRFGLKNHTEMTLQAVADQLQVTRERVRQIQNEALVKLKQQFGFDLMLFLEPNDT
jgi:RNA polymerase primary sigma factor